MTKEREAGRALDAEVAEKVMGLRWGRFDYEPVGWLGPNKDNMLAPFRWLCSPDMRGFVPAKNDGSETWFIGNVSRYSEEIAAAFQVVEAMRAKGRRIELCELVQWRATFSGANSTAVSATAATPAIAICLAALAALAPDSLKSAVEIPAPSPPGETK